MNPILLPIGLAAFAAGAALGLAYFAALRRSVGLFARGGWRMVALLSLARIAVAVGAFLLLAKLGAIPLVCGAAGFLLARTISIRKARAAG